MDESAVHKQVEQFCLNFKVYMHQGSIAAGDIATVQLQSADAFFNRTLKINVGKGFYNKELEDALVGLEIGSDCCVEHSKAGRIAVRVLDVQRLQIPELTDALVQQGGLDNIHTAEDYIRKIRRDLSMEDFRDRSYRYIDEVISESEIFVDRDEVESLAAQELNRCRDIAKSQGMVFDEMTEEQLLGAVGQPDIPGFMEMVRGYSHLNICQALLVLHWQGKDAAEVPVVQDRIVDISCEASDYIVERLLEKYQLA